MNIILVLPYLWLVGNGATWGTIDMNYYYYLKFFHSLLTKGRFWALQGIIIEGLGSEGQQRVYIRFRSLGCT